MCDIMATCESDVCVCPTSHTGNGISCEELSDVIDIPRVTVIPISRIPLITVRSAICRDDYWLKIGDLGPGTSVVLQYNEPNWLPCIDHLRFKGMDIFVTVNGRKGQLSNMVSYYQDQISQIQSDYGSSISGIYIRNPGNNGYLADFYSDVFDLIKSEGFKIGLDGYGNQYSASIAAKADIVVVFSDDIDRFRHNCGKYGPGPLCQNNALSDTEISDIENEIIFGTLKRDQFVSIVYDVEEALLATVYAESLSSFAGLAFISSFNSGNTREPAFFDSFISMATQSANASSNLAARITTEECGCSPVDECDLGTHTCPSNSDCFDTTSGYECKCSIGFQNDPNALALGQFTCIDIDECAAKTDNCDDNAECTNTDGSFECVCSNGFIGNGQTCSDINECSESDTCDVNAVCTNLLGTHVCVCNEGFSGDGVSCDDVDECSTSTDNCSQHGVCLNTMGSFSCSCQDGFTGDGITCNDVDECVLEIDTCHSMSSCANTIGSFDCSCLDGFNGDGFTCSQDICSLCSPSATCDNVNCQCPSGYSGSGVACPSSARAVIPIERIPIISVRTGKCSDPFWYAVAELKDSATIVTRLQETTWIPCMSHAQQNGVQIYATINARKMKLGVSYLRDQIQDIVNDYGSLLSGIHFENPESVEGFTGNEWTEVFDFAKTAGMLISIEGY